MFFLLCAFLYANAFALEVELPENYKQGDLISVNVSKVPTLLNSGEPCKDNTQCASSSCINNLCELKAGKPHAQYVKYDFNQPTTDHYEIYLTWLKAPTKDQGVFAAFNFKFESGLGGYLGFQQTSGFKKRVLFSIWSDLNTYTANCISSGLGTNLVFCGQKQTPVENRFAQAGGFYPWEVGVEYKFLLKRTQTLDDSETWQATVTDLRTNQSVEVGTIKLNNYKGYKGYGLLRGSVNTFMEYFAPLASKMCDPNHAHSIYQWRGPYINGSLAVKATNTNGTIGRCHFERQYSPSQGVVVQEGGGTRAYPNTSGQLFWII